MGKTAILVDGGFYRMRALALNGSKEGVESAQDLKKYCISHLRQTKDKKIYNRLYRIFYYDCPPMKKKLYHPYTKKQVDFSKTEMYTWMNEYLAELKQQRKFALRLGNLAENQAHFRLKHSSLKKLFNGDKLLENITENDFELAVDQKCVDIKIGVDIASLAYNKHVDQIVLISGDGDFVPAAKLARREGIDFILDNMHAPIVPDLHEHIDELKTYCPKPKVQNGSD